MNNAIYSNMDATGDYHTKWSKSEREREIPYDTTYMWNLKYGTNEEASVLYKLMYILNYSNLLFNKATYLNLSDTVCIKISMIHHHLLSFCSNRGGKYLCI